MIVPNKVIPYEESLLSKLPLVLHCLNEPRSPDRLYSLVKNSFENVHQFVVCIDILYVLNRIELKDGDLRLC